MGLRGAEAVVPLGLAPSVNLSVCDGGHVDERATQQPWRDEKKEEDIQELEGGRWTVFTD